ncbi:restriction endonuclease subunit S [Peptoniphilus sp. MSJ-1]|uniref:Restriction endonuclease subunit S n=1 Tax=Peptoniphilus ovalis TaxID=2841503 RepID=A0ABS6FEI4_9FIRM|nr:restriction endonuclease subunit S [Peptoniphilus ovalis]MBU5668587.1 restriction endonuclease subunit S [Peptoniphilus ovalis]
MTRKMKDSGIEWIGEIPEDWEVSLLKYLIVDRQGGVWGNEENYEDITNNRICIRIADFNYPEMIVNKDKGFTIRNYKKREIIKYTLNKGDILVEKSGGGEKTPVGRTVIWDEDIEALYANFIERLRVDSSKISPMYAQYCFYSFYGMGGSNLYFNQTTGIQNLDITKMMGSLKFPLPNLIQQKKIVDKLNLYLDDIKSITLTINQEIKKLEEYKKSVITEAVTKGLDKNVEMKDSGIEWIGEIPKHWKTPRIKDVALLKARIGWQGLRSDEFLYDENLPYLITGTDFKNGYVNWSTCVRVSEERFHLDRNIQVKENDLLITKDGTIGKLAIVRNCPSKVTLNSGVFVMRNQGNYKYIDRYMYYLLQSIQFELWFELNDSGNSTIRHLYQKDFYNFKFTYPSIEEQKEIVDYLDKKTKTIDESIQAKEKQLEILEEYKKSLIYEYVTGKKEVPSEEFI